MEFFVSIEQDGKVVEDVAVFSSADKAHKTADKLKAEGKNACVTTDF
jgi:hypothetical protein